MIKQTNLTRQRVNRLYTVLITFNGKFVTDFGNRAPALNVWMASKCYFAITLFLLPVHDIRARYFSFVKLNYGVRINNISGIVLQLAVLVLNYFLFVELKANEQAVNLMVNYRCCPWTFTTQMDWLSPRLESAGRRSGAIYQIQISHRPLRVYLLKGQKGHFTHRKKRSTNFYFISSFCQVVALNYFNYVSILSPKLSSIIS